MNPVFKYAGGSCLISGQLVFNSLDDLSKDLLGEAGKSGAMSIDLKQVSDCDSTFVALLTACLQIKKQQGQQMLLNGCSKKLRAMLEIYGLSDSGLLVK